MPEQWTQAEFQEYLKSVRTPNRDINTSEKRDAQRSTRQESLVAQKVPRLVARCHITVNHYRFRLADRDNLTAKAFIDGLRRAGILRDDGPNVVERFNQEQFKVASQDEEKTEVIIQEFE